MNKQTQAQILKAQKLLAKLNAPSKEQHDKLKETLNRLRSQQS